ncbi:MULTISPECIES: hypothetical protein [unclassified Brevundimonas]|jgi:hypothetical protein|uniref:hypothetical protein n=1 Tax=unclassified Brevundimonas TaxID=2622653 RepID=UPI00257EB9A1|nr:MULTISPECIES: hypothetical protein [unclassified Brevundimonas]|tara:strand:+ start:12352 stop:12513 length:162 start_codon:yes stop_codon:yes gene_type:complete
MSDRPEGDQKPKDIPALFATIHFRSDERPDGYTDEDIQALNTLANQPRPKPSE